MSNVPKARETIVEVIAELRAAGRHGLAKRLDAVLLDLHRRPPARKRAPASSAPVDAEMAAFLRKFARSHPDLPLAEIGHRFGINPGRVAEALHGDR